MVVSTRAGNVNALERAKETTLERSSTSKPPQFNGKKGDKNIMWKMKSEADQVMKGLFDAFHSDFEKELPSKEKANFDLSSEEQRRQQDAVKMNQNAMMQLALSFTSVSLMNKLNVEKRRDKDWPTGKAHKVMSPLVKEFEPEDTMAEMEME